MKRIQKVLLPVLMAFLVLTCTGCGETGTPPLLTVGGVEITLGESTMGALEKEGFEMSVPGGGLLIGKMEARSYLTSLISAKKDNETHAYLYIYNPTLEEKFYGSCVIYQLKFTMNSEEKSYWAKDNVLVNGINFFGMDSAAVKEAMSAYKLARETDNGSLRYEDGDFKYYFYFDEATKVVSEVTVEMDIPNGY